MTCVLLADDDSQMRYVLAHHLRKWGYAVVEARDGHHLDAMIEALILDTPDHRPHVDVVLTDVRMPGPSGMQALARLHAHRVELPIILMTAFGDPDLHTEARLLGAAAVFDKPFDLDDLCTAVLNLATPRRSTTALYH